MSHFGTPCRFPFIHDMVLTLNQGGKGLKNERARGNFLSIKVQLEFIFENAAESAFKRHELTTVSSFLSHTNHQHNQSAQSHR